MTLIGWFQILIYCAIIIAITPVLGGYMTKVFSGERTFLSPVLHPVEAVIYKAAGVDAIFPGSPFERRFRDIHTLSQQIQARGAHFEAVGQVLLGVPPDTFL